VDGTSVYWTNAPASTATVTNPGSVMKASLASGTATTLATGQADPENMALDTSAVYWTNSVNGGAVVKATLDGATVTTLAPGENFPRGIAVVGTTVYWANCGGATGGVGSAVRDEAGGGLGDFVATQGAWGLVAAGDVVYWSDFTAGTVTAVANGGTLAFSVGGLTQPQALAIDTANIYWTEVSSGAIKAASISVHPGQEYPIAGGRAQPTALASDGTNVYWTEVGTGGGLVMKAPVAGGGAVTTLATGQLGAAGVAVDGTSVYWTARSAGTVMKLTPK